MPREIIRRAEAVPATSMIALAIGAAAFGAVAVGARWQSAGSPSAA